MFSFCWLANCNLDNSLNRFDPAAAPVVGVPGPLIFIMRDFADFSGSAGVIAVPAGPILRPA